MRGVRGVIFFFSALQRLSCSHSSLTAPPPSSPRHLGHEAKVEDDELAVGRAEHVARVGVGVEEARVEELRQVHEHAEVHLRKRARSVRTAAQAPLAAAGEGGVGSRGEGKRGGGRTPRAQERESERGTVPGPRRRRPGTG